MFALLGLLGLAIAGTAFVGLSGSDDGGDTAAALKPEADFPDDWPDLLDELELPPLADAAGAGDVLAETGGDDTLNSAAGDDYINGAAGTMF